MSEKHISAREAARLLGVSLDTLRRWDKSGKIMTNRDNANRRVVSLSEVERLANPTKPRTTNNSSARNRITCTVTDIETDGFLARVELLIAEPTRLVAVITRESIEDLEIEIGATVTAAVKSTSMMIDIASENID